MRRACLIFGLLAATAGPARADESADTKQIIDRALKAAGGEEKLAQGRAYTFKLELRNRGATDAKEEVRRQAYFVQPPDRLRVEEDEQEDGRRVRIVRGVKGWRQWEARNGVVGPVPWRGIDPGMYPAGRESRPFDPQLLYGFRYLLVARAPRTAASPLRDPWADDSPVFGVKLTQRVTRRLTMEHRLFFDPQTGLLASSVVHTSDEALTLPLSVKTVWEDYRTIEGVAVPHRVTLFSEGKPTKKYVYSDFEFKSKLDPKLFEEP